MTLLRALSTSLLCPTPLDIPPAESIPVLKIDNDRYEIKSGDILAGRLSALCALGFEDGIFCRNRFHPISLSSGDYPKRKGDLAVAQLEFGGLPHRLVVRQDKAYAVLGLSNAVSADRIVSEIVMCAGEGVLGIVGVDTIEDFRRHGYNAVLRRCAYLLAGRPKRVFLHNMVHSNPFYNDVAEEYLNSGYFRRFWPKRMIGALERMFGAKVVDIGLLDEEDFHLELTGSYDVRVDAMTNFHVELTMDPSNPA